MVKITEQCQHAEILANHEECNHLWVFATFCYQRPRKYDGQKAKLRNLKLGNVLLPPHRLLELGLEGGQEIVGIHHTMNESVDNAETNCRTARIPFRCQVRQEKHSAMMVAMKKSKLIVLLPQNDENLREE